MMKSRLRLNSASSSSIRRTSCLILSIWVRCSRQRGSISRAFFSCSAARLRAFIARSSRPARSAVSALASQLLCSSFSLPSRALACFSVAMQDITACLASLICFSLSRIAWSSISSGVSNLSMALLTPACPTLNILLKILIFLFSLNMLIN